MRHRQRTRRLGVKMPHRLAMLRNLTLGLIEHGRIKTTVARAKSLRPFVERLVTRLKSPTVANFREAHSDLPHKAAVAAIAANISPKFKDRPGGYLRILKLASPRAGDAADMALIEWVDESLVNAYNEVPAAKTAKAGSKKSTKGGSKKTASKKEAGDSTPKAKKKASKASAE